MQTELQNLLPRVVIVPVTNPGFGKNLPVWTGNRLGVDTAVIATCVALGLTILGFVAAPLFETTSVPSAGRGRGQFRLALNERKEQLYASIKELEFDHSLGKLSDEEYHRQRSTLENQAVDILRELDLLDEFSSERIARIERDVAEARSGLESRGGAASFCTACGAPRSASHRFCSQCGARL